MVKKLLMLFSFFMVMYTVFAVEFGQPYVPESEFKSQLPESNMPFSNQTWLRDAVSCPMCDGDVVDGVCTDCGYILGTGTGTENSPMRDNLWALLGMACIYFCYKQKNRKKLNPDT